MTSEGRKERESDDVVAVDVVVAGRYRLWKKAPSLNDLQTPIEFYLFCASDRQSPAATRTIAVGEELHQNLNSP